jgi:hypothetical protein
MRLDTDTGASSSSSFSSRSGDVGVGYSKGLINCGAAISSQDLTSTICGVFVRDGTAGGPPPGGGGTDRVLERLRAGGLGGVLVAAFKLAFPVLEAEIGCNTPFVDPFSSPGLDSKYLGRPKDVSTV